MTEFVWWGHQARGASSEDDDILVALLPTEILKKLREERGVSDEVLTKAAEHLFERSTAIVVALAEEMVGMWRWGFENDNPTAMFVAQVALNQLTDPDARTVTKSGNSLMHGLGVITRVALHRTVIATKPVASGLEMGVPPDVGEEFAARMKSAVVDMRLMRDEILAMLGFSSVNELRQFGGMDELDPEDDD